MPRRAPPKRITPKTMDAYEIQTTQTEIARSREDSKFATRDVGVQGADVAEARNQRLIWSLYFTIE